MMPSGTHHIIGVQGNPGNANKATEAAAGEAAEQFPASGKCVMRVDHGLVCVHLGHDVVYIVSEQYLCVHV